MGIYYLITALWPLISIKTFELVTGPKVDKWLVYTVSCLLIAPSFLYIYTGLNEELISPLIIFLAFTNGILLILIDVIFVLKKVIWKTYLVDAILQIILLTFLAFSDSVTS